MLGAEQETKRLQLHRAEVIKEKSPAWKRSLVATVRNQANEVTAELGKRIELRTSGEHEFTFNTTGYPASSVVCTLDPVGQCIRVVVRRKLSASETEQVMHHQASFVKNTSDELAVRFEERTYVNPEQFGAHVLELGIFGEHPPKPERAIVLEQFT